MKQKVNPPLPDLGRKIPLPKEEVVVFKECFTFSNYKPSLLGFLTVLRGQRGR